MTKEYHRVKWVWAMWGRNNVGAFGERPARFLPLDKLHPITTKDVDKTKDYA